MQRISLNDELVITQYYAFRSTGEVAKIYGCSDETIRRLLLRNGIELTKWKRPDKDREKCYKYAPLDDADRKLIIDEYAKCKMIKTVAEKTGHSSDTVSKVVHDVFELEQVKICKRCGKPFKTDRQSKIWCSRTCRNIANPGDDRKRCRRYGVYFDASVKHEAVLERDHYRCQICGVKCNPNDKEWGHSGATYPTVDHIIPLAKGGTHTWNNVQCACGRCNSRKQDKIV